MVRQAFLVASIAAVLVGYAIGRYVANSNSDSQISSRVADQWEYKLSENPSDLVALPGEGWELFSCNISSSIVEKSQTGPHWAPSRAEKGFTETTAEKITPQKMFFIFKRRK